MSKASLSKKHAVPWLPHDAEQGGCEDAYNSYFEVRYKRRYLLMMILIMFGMAWVGLSTFDKDMTEIFFAVAPAILVPFIIRFFGVILALTLAVLIPAALYFTLPDLAELLGKAIAVSMFLVVFPLIGLALAFRLFDRRPQLLIGPEGICCRQFSEDLVPWEDITFTRVLTYDRHWFLKIRHLDIGLRDFSCYPTPSSAWTPQYLFYSVSRLWKKPDDSASIAISTVVLDPSLPFVMKAIEHHRPKLQRRRSRSPKTTKT